MSRVHRSTTDRGSWSLLRAPAFQLGASILLGVEVGWRAVPGLGAGASPILLVALALAFGLCPVRVRIGVCGTLVGLLAGALGAGELSLAGGALDPADAAVHDRLLEGIPVAVRVRSCETWREEPFALRSRCRLVSVRWRDRVEAVRAFVSVSLPRDSAHHDLRCARLLGRLSRLRPPRNGVEGPWGTDRIAIRGLALRVKSDRLVTAESCGRLVDLWGGASDAVKGRWVAVSEEVSAGGESAERAANLARAMWTGQRGLIPAAVRARFVNWGVVHLLAVSGLHVGLVVGAGVLLSSVLAPGGTRSRLEVAWVFLAGIWMLLSVGPRPSVVRALVMGAALLAARWTRRPSSGVSHLGLAVALLCLVAPETTRGAAFRLSVAATLGILVGAPALSRCWQDGALGRIRPLSTTLAVSVTALLATLPLSVDIDPVVPVASPLANLVAVPLAALILAAGGVWLLVGGDTALDAVLALPAEALLEATRAPPSPLLQPLWSWSQAAMVAWAVLALLWIARPVRRWPLLLLLAAALHWPAGQGTSASFLDVGQGDAVLLRSQGEGVLVDGGGWRGGDVAAGVLVPVLARERLSSLRAVVLTHGDHDHCGGLLDLSRRVAVGELWLGAAEYEGECFTRLVRRFEGRTRILHRGDEVRVGRWRLSVVSDGRSRATENGRSLVLRSDTGFGSVLLTGDIDAAAERELLASVAPAELRVDWLKVAHHGSRSSSSVSFLEAVAPATAVVSAGARNVYGHPAEEVIVRLRNAGVVVRRTDLEGRVDYRPERSRVQPRGWVLWR